MRVLVMGDICTDINYHGEIKSISPEAPIPIFNIKSKEERMGMSANVHQNLLNAGCNSHLHAKNYMPWNTYKMTKKHRYFANNHYLYRIDENDTEIMHQGHQKYILGLLSTIEQNDAIILQDYNKGFFTKAFIKKLIKTVKKYNPKCLIVADGHKSRSLDFYKGVDYLKLNEDEACALKFYPNSKLSYKVIVTYGKNGSILYLNNNKIIDTDAFAEKVVDSTGAGDTFTSYFTVGMLKYKSEKKALEMANIAAGISVEHLGCYAPTIKEVEKRMKRV